MTKTLEAVADAMANLASNKLRSGLTMLGVIIGVAAVISISSIVEGGKRLTVEMIEKLGTNLLSIRPKQLTEEERRAFAGRSKGLRYKDLHAISEAMPLLDKITPVLAVRLPLKQGNRAHTGMIEGVGETYMEIQNYSMDHGRFLMSEDLTRFKKVVVLGREISEKLFGDADPVGRDIKVGNHRFVVVGRLAEKGSLHGINYDMTVLIPATTMIKLFTGNDTLSSLVVKVRERQQMQGVSEQIRSLLLSRHDGVEDFSIRSQDQLVRNVELILFTFSVIFSGTAALALLVGGIGIMNIMLVTVVERTQEIGIRMAVGASRRAILVQFLIESVVLSLVGGIIGILCGMLIGKGFGWLANRAIEGWQAVILPASVFLGFFFAFSVGITFGLYPAYKASRLDPARALRFV